MTRRRASLGEGLLVCAQQCNQCLFSKDKIVSDDRRQEILRGLERDDTHFQCHKHTMKGTVAVCAGDFKRDPLRTSGFRIARALNAVVLVDEDGFVVKGGRS